MPIPDTLPPDAVLVYQMGKVGSVTMYRTVRTFCPDLPVFHVHYVTDTSIDHMPPEEVRSAKWNRAIRRRFERGHLVKQALEARIRLLKEEPSRQKIRILTAVRDPLGLFLSGIFHFGHLFLPGLEGESLLRELQDLLFSLEAPESGGWKTRLLRGMTDDCLHWFQRELLPATGIDVYAEPFPKSQGYHTYESRFARCLLIRQENLASFPGAASAFLGRPIDRMVSGNIASEKEYHREYAMAKKTIRFGPNFAEMCYSTGYFPLLYPPEDKNRLLRRWTQGKAGE